MSRQHVSFAGEGSLLGGTLDRAAGTTGLLIVTGGNEIRSGAYSGQAQLAAAIARAGFPVFRFDRRGVGDSEGESRGFRNSREDILAANQMFRELCPQVDRVVAFGNCDAASALMLMQGDMCDALVLSNPWTFEEGQSDELPPEAIRLRYVEKLRNPAEVMRLLKVGVDLRKLARGVFAALKPPPPPSSLAQDMAAGLDASTKPYMILLAMGDRTAKAFENVWDEQPGTVRRCEGASHSYVEPHARVWLQEQVLEVLRG
jgi:exosortase A-associated hydrolase 1